MDEFLLILDQQTTHVPHLKPARKFLQPMPKSLLADEPLQLYLYDATLHRVIPEKISNQEVE